MSVMIQKPENTAALADFLSKILNYGTDLFNIHPSANLQKAFIGCCDKYGYFGETERYYDSKLIYEQLAALNLKAYNVRYNENVAEIAPYKHNSICRRISLKDEVINGSRRVFVKLEPWHFQIYKMLQFYLYQCSEDETCNDPIFLALEEFENYYATYLVENSKRYNSFDWE